MASNVICGRCGTVLDGPSATCRTCGSRRLGGARSGARRPWLAALLAALIPGLGHLYVGHYRKGVFYLLAAGGLEFVGLDLDLTALGAAVGVPMGLGGLGLWAHGVWDAYHLARASAPPHRR